jgi:hypothetical protein
MVKDTLIEKDHLLAVQESLMGFILDEVIIPAGKHYFKGPAIEELHSHLHWKLRLRKLN